MVTILKTRPLDIKNALEALTSESKISILKALLENPQGLTASQIAKKLNLKIPTVLTHLEPLENLGLIKIQPIWKKGKILKTYQIAEKDITIQIDIELYVRIPSKNQLEEQMLTYIETKRKQGILPAQITIQDLTKILKIDQKQAIILLDYIRKNQQTIIKILTPQILETFRQQKAFTITEAANKLKTHQYWIAKTIDNLAQKGYCSIENGKVMLHIT